MFNARNLLGQIMEAGMTGSATRRMQHALGPDGLGQPQSPLMQMLGGGGSGALGGLADMAQGMLGGATRSVQSGNPLAVGGLGALAGALLGGGGGAAKGAIGGGALALLGTIAMSAMKNWGETGATAGTEELAREAPLGLREPQSAAEEEELDRTAALCLRAMISVAKADGQIDGAEMERIDGKLRELGADEEARAFVTSEMRKPMDLSALVGEVRSPQTAVEVYAASLLAVEVDTPAERDYMRRLADGLQLDRDVTQRVHQALGLA